jgi:hypothetical protein
MDRHEIRFLLNYLENNPVFLNSLQYDFIVALKDHYKWTGVLTKKQEECLNDIKGHIPSLSLEEAECESDKYPAQYSSFDFSMPFNM